MTFVSQQTLSKWFVPISFKSNRRIRALESLRDNKAARLIAGRVFSASVARAVPVRCGVYPYILDDLRVRSPKNFRFILVSASAARFGESTILSYTNRTGEIMTHKPLEDRFHPGCTSLGDL
ncbi:hypothetical protein EVAR_28212_1 [Eumeta japonica]|uniref:Uncharacterized protein n=1 Tax=Eumeta variegata TaxID=151549 RepID=A0A4C1VKL9_EUMVA|nr:hypothetical protein EVAR_28212_1 [Eumeta japonica]